MIRLGSFEVLVNEIERSKDCTLLVVRKEGNPSLIIERKGFYSFGSKTDLYPVYSISLPKGNFEREIVFSAADIEKDGEPGKIFFMISYKDEYLEMNQTCRTGAELEDVRFHVEKIIENHAKLLSLEIYFSDYLKNMAGVL